MLSYAGDFKSAGGRCVCTLLLARTFDLGIGTAHTFAVRKGYLIMVLFLTHGQTIINRKSQLFCVSLSLSLIFLIKNISWMRMHFGKNAQASRGAIATPLSSAFLAWNDICLDIL